VFILAIATTEGTRYPHLHLVALSRYDFKRIPILPPLMSHLSIVLDKENKPWCGAIPASLQGKRDSRGDSAVAAGIDMIAYGATAPITAH
jgi:hypothetical protein